MCRACWAVVEVLFVENVGARAGGGMLREVQRCGCRVGLACPVFSYVRAVALGPRLFSVLFLCAWYVCCCGAVVEWVVVLGRCSLVGVALACIGY